ncbi:MAG: RrF2 family transcriptional regulator [Bacteroidota bacterium]
MFRLSKKVEYGLLAMQHLASQDGKLVCAKEMADALCVSFEFLSKSLQKLMKHGLIKSQQGIKGGYFLADDAANIKLNDVLRAYDENASIVECMNGSKSSCERRGCCTLRNPMAIVQDKINKIFDEMTVADLVKEHFIKLETEIPE